VLTGLNIINPGRCIPDWIISYIYIMKNKITLSDYLPDPKEEDLKAAAKRRENYALIRDLQAEDYNEAIVRRLAKEKEKQV
jgi:hypothetical protein